MRTLSFTIKDKKLRAKLNELSKKPDALKQPFLMFAQYMRVTTDKTFKRLRHGGRFRGVTWDYFKPQYTRKTDGMVVPAWGGVNKLRGKGKVKGQKRPSGARIARGDSIMQDTMTMRARAALVIRMDKHKVRLGPQGVNYAARQNARRPFLFFTKADGGVFSKMLRDYVTGGDSVSV